MNSSKESLDNSINEINFSQEIFKRLRRSKKRKSSNCVLTKCRNIGLSKKNGISNETRSKTSQKTHSNIINDNSNASSSSIVSTQQLQKLESWGLPPGVLAKYEERGIKEMFPWQVECLSNIKILNEHANLVYSAPTSAGKTLVAEILAIKTVLERQRKVLIILPFVSVVREKMFYFQDIFRSNGVRVEGFMGSYNPPGGFSKVQVAICTIEKANNIVNRLLEDNNIEEIGAVVIDELHLLGDPSRGYLLELLLTKLLYISKKKPEFKIQIIGMSATLPNLSSLSTWLNAELFKTDFRPIPLLEQCYMNGVLYDSKIAVIRKIEPHPDIPKDMDNIIQFCLETIYCSCSVLIFCSAKNWCETLAQQISSTFRQLGRSESPLGVCLREQLKTDSIIEVLEQLKRCPVGLDTILKITVSFGVAFHHAGLTIDERDIIEGGFRNGAIRVLVATSTLSAGVNLPARRVIIRSPMFGGKPMDTLTYRQMIGRAGRMGKDTAGESILICQKNEKYAAEQLLSGNLKPISSCLEGSGRLKRAILEVIASGVAISPNDVKLFTECTLLASSEIFDEIENPIEETVHFLLRNEFIRLQKSETNQMQYVATSLAKACLSSAMPPEEGLTLFAELEKARQCFVLESELHIIYLVTPYSACNQWGTIDWMFYQSLWDELSQADQRVGELIGISESYIARAMSGRINNSKSQHRLHIHRRFYVALALRELVEEVPLATVAEKYKCNRGLLQSLQQSASTFAGMVTAFSKQLGWSSVELLVSQFQDRLQFGVSRELLDLARMPSLNGICARLLFNAGIETIVILASTDVCTLENILTRAVPFERENDGETDYEKRKKLKTVWISGKNGLTEREAAEMLIIEARNFLKYEMGIAEAKWDTEVSSNSTQIETADTLDTSTKLYVSLNSITQASKNSTQNTSNKLNENVIDSSESLKSKTFEVEKTLEKMNEDLNDNLIDNSDLSTSKTQEITPAIIDNSLPRTFVLDENKENHSEIVQNSLPRTFVLENDEMKIINNICADENSKSTSSKTNQSVNTVLEKINESNTNENVQFNSKIFESDSTFDNICITGHLESKTTTRSNPEKGETKINESKLFGNDGIHSKMFESDSMFNNISVAENSKSTSSKTSQTSMILEKINDSKTTENAQFNSNNISIARNLESKTTPPRNIQSPTKDDTKIIEYKPFENDKINSKMFESDSIFNNISTTENLVSKQTPQIDGAKINESKPFENVEINSKIFESESMLDNICITDVSEPKSIPSGSIHDPNMSELQRSTENHEIIIRNFESESMPENVLESNSTPPVTKSNNSSFQTPDSFNDGIFDETPSVLNRVQLCAEEFAKASDYYVLENNFSSNIEFNISGMNLKTAKSYNWSTLDNAQLTDLENNKTVLNDTNKSGSLFDESILITSNICKILDNQIEKQLKNDLDSKEELQVDENQLKNSFLEQAFDSFTISNNSKSLDDDIVLNSNDESMESPCFDRTGKSTSKLHENTKRKLLLINKTMKSVIVTNNKRILKTISPLKNKNNKIKKVNSPSKHKKDKIETVNSINKDKKDKIETVNSINKDKKDKIQTINLTSKHNKDNIEILKQNKTDKIETFLSENKHKKDKIETINSPSKHKKDQTETINLLNKDKKDKIEIINSLDKDKKAKIETINSPSKNKKDQIKTINLLSKHKKDQIEIINSSNHKKDKIETMKHNKHKIETINSPSKHKKDNIETLKQNKTDIEKFLSENKHKKDEIEKISPNKRKTEQIETLISPNKHKKNKIEPKNEPKISPKKDKIETIRGRKSLRTRKIDHIEIIDVCKNRKLFETITRKLFTKTVLTISVACEKFIKSKSEIGNRMIRYRSGLKNDNSNTKKVNRFVINDRQVIGFSVYCEYNIVYFFSLSADAFVPENEILEFFQKLFLNKELTVYQFDAKEQIKLLLQLNFSIQCKYLDPKIIEWLFDPENREQSFHNLIRNYSPELKDLAKSAGKSSYQESIALNIDSSISGKLRSATEALCTWHVIEAQQSKIIQQKWNMKKILNVEMGTIICLANMEVIGFGVNTEQLDQILSIVQEKMADIETECYSLVGRHFSLASATEVAKVLKFAKTRTKVSTNKQVLEKLENPLAALIILWRKLNTILTKTLFPVLREINGSRIYCCSDSFNATGRITMYEPSLQSIPRDFEVPINDSILMLSVRSAFVPKDGYVLISADYCQLELRLLAHFSKDKRLCAIMHSDDDVFQLIAAKWNRIPIDEVDDVTRNRAKQLCYGIIYGMGVKTLSDQLEIDENQATEMIESFKNTYPKIRDFIEATIENCRKVGYVETLYGRRRYLEHINKSNSLKSQAERQAVNTTIQGSAADIAKTAMVRIHKTLQEQYDETETVANLVLHMHDELIYEAKITELNSIMVIIKHCMESAVHLSVPFPVKIKYGYSWGEMEVVDNVAEHRSR